MGITFNPSPACTLGVEVELQLVDGTTRELSNSATEVLAALGRDHPDGDHPRAKHELMESTVEIITGVCDTVAEARADLDATLSELRVETDRRGLELLCAGTHPFSRWEDQRISPDARYHELVAEMQWTARRLAIFGIHVHVGVRSAEKAIAIANGLASYIPHFLGLSASSPYWTGRDTGLASARSKVFEGLPTAGLPYQLSGWTEFERFMQALISARTIRTIRELWWDIRPHPNFGTVELRICDGLPTLREVASVAALSHSLVAWLDELHDREGTVPVQRGWVVRDNKWRAARHGMDAEIIVDDEGRLIPLRQAVADLVAMLTPMAERLGCGAELAGVTALAERPSYRRQRELVAGGSSLVEVVDMLVEELRTDEPWGCVPGRPE